MKGYSNMVCGIVKDHGGRVHTLMGDGIIAIFGEYLNDPQQTVIKAINAASSICREFESLKKEFFEYENISEFQRREYEKMEFRIGIGINYGPVIFDYFGVSGNRIFAPLGDHVNFAQRLETEANRFDSRLLDRKNRMRAPILVSRPAWIASGEYGDPDPLLLSVKGRPNEYECYQYWP
jgi:adenylate cyclase